MNAPAPAVHISLHSYLKQIEGVIKRSFAEHIWVVAELSEFNVRNGGTCWFTLIESADGKEIAKCSAVMFGSVANVQLRAFEQVTGSKPQPGMKVMLKVCATLHPQYGFQLQVYGIDPNYTLGEMHAKVEQILARLKEEGIHDRQKALAAPAGFWRIAVVSPDQAAGLGDFRREADLLERHGLVSFHYYTATFQGEKAPESIKQAILQLYEAHGQAPYDVVCLIRGGGAKADMAWLNHYGLAKLICRLPIPVFTGIGHERDETVLDLVAHTRFDTPSKVIGSILRHLQLESEELGRNIELARQLIDQTLSREETCLVSLHGQYQNLSQQRLSNETLSLAELGHCYRRGVDELLNRHERQVTLWQAQAQSMVRESLQSASDRLHNYQERYLAELPSLVAEEEQCLGNLLTQYTYLAERRASDAAQELMLARQALSMQLDTRLAEEQRCVDSLAGQYLLAAQGSLQQEEASLQRYKDLYAVLDPRAIMAKGFALVKREDGQIVRSALGILVGDRVEICFHDGVKAVVIQQ